MFRSFKASFKALFFISFVFCLLARVVQERLVVDFNPDKIIQLSTALNYIDGNGISIKYAASESLDEEYFERVGLWPPGFVVFIGPLLKLGLIPIQASFVLEIIAICILFLSFWKIFLLLDTQVSNWIFISFFLFQGVATGFYTTAGTTDIISLSFTVYALYLLLRCINRQILAAHGVYFGFIAFLPSFFRFAYYPISLAIPFLFLFFCFLYDKPKIKIAWIALLACSGLIFFQLVYQSYMPTGINYLNDYHPDTSDAPYWDNLRMFINLPIEVLADNYLIKRSVSAISPTLYTLGSIFLWLILISGFVLACALIFKEIRLSHKSFFESPKNQFLVAGLMLICITIFFLTIMSLKYPPEEAAWLPEKKWTYVRETRYFALPILLLPWIIFIKLYDKCKNFYFLIPVLLIYVLSISFSSLVNTYHLYKYGTGTLYENFAKYNHFNIELGNYLEEVKLNSEIPVVYMPGFADDKYALYSILCQIPIVKLDNFDSLGSKKPVRLILNWNESLSQNSKKIISGIIKEYNLQPVKEFSDIQVILYELNLP